MQQLALVFGAALSLICVPDALGAQRYTDARVGITEPIAEHTRLDSRLMIPRAPARSYWKEGGIITALAAVVAGNLLARDASGGQRLLGSLMAAPVFFVPGALIGSLFPKAKVPVEDGGPAALRGRAMTG